MSTIVRPWWEPTSTSRGYEVIGPDKDGDVCIEFNMDARMIWLTRRDVEMILARWPNTPDQERVLPSPEAGCSRFSDNHPGYADDGTDLRDFGDQ